MTIVQVFWVDGVQSSYTFDNKRVAFAFLDEIRAFDDHELGNGNIVCSADLRLAPRARAVARRLGATYIVVRNVVKAGPP